MMILWMNARRARRIARRHFYSRFRHSCRVWWRYIKMRIWLAAHLGQDHVSFRMKDGPVKDEMAYRLLQRGFEVHTNASWIKVHWKPDRCD